MHPWVWLNEPQHGTAIQAVCSIIYTVAAIGAGIFAAGAYRAARQQANAALEQIKLTRLQYASALQEAEERRLAELQKRRTEFNVKRIQDDSGRPRFISDEYREAGAVTMAFRNLGATPAREVRIYDDQDAVVADKAFVPVGDFILCDISMEGLMDGSYTLSFRSDMGSLFTVQLWLEADEVIGVSRSYENPDLVR